MSNPMINEYLAVVDLSVNTRFKAANKGENRNSASQILRIKYKGYSLLTKPAQELLWEFDVLQTQLLLRTKKDKIRTKKLDNLKILISKMEKMGFTFLPDLLNKDLYDINHPCFTSANLEALEPRVGLGWQQQLYRERPAQVELKQPDQVVEVSTQLSKLEL